jgi:GDP-4-dehydro-6-deoxy-D-mannose reductase
VKVLLTGASGFIGRRLAAELVAGGHDVLGASNEGGVEYAGGQSLTLDVLDADAVLRLADSYSPEVVVHLAGLANVGASWRKPDLYFQVNVLGTENVLNAFPDTKVLLASSAEIYGDVPEAQQPLNEERTPAPGNPYALTKAAAERLVLDRGGAVMRLFTIIGPGQSLQFALPSFARQLAELHQAGTGALRVGNLAARRDFLHVDDAIRAILLLATVELPESIYNVGGGEVASLDQALGRLIEIAGVDVDVEIDPDRMRPADIALLRADSGRLGSLGWSPLRSIDEALEEIWTEQLAVVAPSA